MHYGKVGQLPKGDLKMQPSVFEMSLKQNVLKKYDLRFGNFFKALSMQCSRDSRRVEACFRIFWYSWSQNSKYSNSFPFPFQLLSNQLKKVNQNIFHIWASAFTEGIISLSSCNVTQMAQASGNKIFVWVSCLAVLGY